ncbi:MAG: Smr/MutS family protein [Clostridia bacterium]|nr:Smr/MutS family protein [Clostridia bacterium]
MIHEINLEIGSPSVDSALRQLEYFIASTRVSKGRVIKIIHGYGSTGKGGKIRASVRRMLKEYKQTDRLTLFIKGEDFSIFDASTRYLIEKFPETASDEDLNVSNAGITYVLL